MRKRCLGALTPTEYVCEKDANAKPILDELMPSMPPWHWDFRNCLHGCGSKALTPGGDTTCLPKIRLHTYLVGPQKQHKRAWVLKNPQLIPSLIPVGSGRRWTFSTHSRGSSSTVVFRRKSGDLVEVLATLCCVEGICLLMCVEVQLASKRVFFF